MLRTIKSFAVLLCVFTISCQHSANKSTESVPTQTPPKLLKPEVKKIWIPEVIKNGGTEWEEGHYLYRIQRDTSWSR
jgi:hypothetical protein